MLVYSFCCLCGFSFVAQAQTTPVVTTGGGATEVASGTATLRGLMTEGVSATAYFCWGSQPGSTGSGADTGTWEHVSASLSITDAVTFSNAVSNLYYGIAYDYAVYAENGSGGAWSDVATFVPTAPPIAPGGTVTPGFDIALIAADDPDGGSDGTWQDTLDNKQVCPDRVIG